MGRPRSEKPIRWVNGVAYVWVYVNGKRVERSTGKRTEEEALAVLAQWRAEASDPDLLARRSTLHDALSLLLEDREAKARSGRLSEETVSYYEKHAGLLLGFFGETCLLSRWSRDSEASWQYVSYRRQTDAGDGTIEKELGTLRTALKIARERGLHVGDPALAVPASFDPDLPVSDRSPSRAEFLLLVPHLSPDAAAITAFILATSAETSALEGARRADLPDTIRPPMQIAVRGTKTDDRDRVVPVVTDEQVLLLKFVKQHAQGKGEQLFASLSNYRRALTSACDAAGVEHASPHAFRHAAGQWLIDLGAPVELVSRVLGHSNTATTERVYARVRPEAVGDRMIEALNPAYAKAANRARAKAASHVATIKKLPSPRVAVLYEIDGVSRTMADWSRATGIPKNTLHHRVATAGLSMAEAIALGSGTRGKVLGGVSRVRNSRNTPAKRGDDPGGSGTSSGVATHEDLQKTPRNPVPRDGVEPPTRGFSTPDGGPKTSENWPVHPLGCRAGAGGEARP